MRSAVGAWADRKDLGDRPVYATRQRRPESPIDRSGESLDRLFLGCRPTFGFDGRPRSAWITALSFLRFSFRGSLRTCFSVTPISRAVCCRANNFYFAFFTATCRPLSAWAISRCSVSVTRAKEQQGGACGLELPPHFRRGITGYLLDSSWYGLAAFRLDQVE